MVLRRPTFAGMFYPDDPSELITLMDLFLSRAHGVEDCYGVVAPHAGYPYSGQVQAASYSCIPEGYSGTFIVLGPSHAGYPTCTSAIDWGTPVGVVSADGDLCRALGIEIRDEAIIARENSLEVQMPFIRHRFPEARIVPILMGHQDYASAMDVASRIIAALETYAGEIRIVASSDFSHYIPDAVARADDHYVIEALHNLNTEEFYKRLVEKRLTACGYGPIAVLSEVCRHLGATEGRLIEYATSGDVSGDFDQVVGYASIAAV